MKVLIDFYATWCGPCRAMKPMIEELEKDYTVLKVDVDEEPEKAEQYGVMGIQTYIVMDGDKEIKRLTGIATKDELEVALRD